MLDTEFLSRLQFAFTISAHILFPAFSIGLATFLVIMEGIWLKTKNPLYLSICKFWLKVFALTFGMGVVSGLVMEFQLGTNWAGFTNTIGDVLGSLFTYEVLTAFFIEAGFLGVMIFGWDKVGPKLHYFSTILVFVGVTLSAFWILSANSWMQTPSGFTIVQGKFIVSSWSQVIFNPSVFPRYFHMLLAAYVTTAFAVAGISAWYLLRNEYAEFARKCFSFALWAALILIILQLYMGDTVGLEVHQHQPLKTAAMEGVWQTQQGAPLLLFAIPDMAAQKNLFTIGVIPHMAAVLNTHQWNGTLLGLSSVAPNYQPYVPFVFLSFRLMVGLGVVMFVIALLGACLRFQNRLYFTKWFQKLCVLASPIGFVALWAGWITAETGRQPWIVYNYLRTDQAFSPVSPAHVLFTFVLLVIVYGIIFGIFYFRYLWRILQQGPELSTPAEEQVFSYLNPIKKPE
ncbi:MAG: cytochrome BD oxidase subunit I [Gammaproteobacteria bacterium RIFCSPHIGHO2_12_FULL_35_23]|nr:MAG: cytochrome BD oxidase subunit I [Gammaproteobacteria bacterium RIFCSPHIGHO2_12_FULL_35_23]